MDQDVSDKRTDLQEVQCLGRCPLLLGHFGGALWEMSQTPEGRTRLCCWWGSPVPGPSWGRRPCLLNVVTASLASARQAGLGLCAQSCCLPLLPSLGLVAAGRREVFRAASAQAEFV